MDFLSRNFIDDDKIWNDIEEGEKASPADVRVMLNEVKDAKHKILDGKIVAALLHNKDKELDEEIFAVAKSIKEQIYGNRIVLFAPLYVSNVCQNVCAYCGFKATNKDLKRKILTHEEIKEEVSIIEDMGHKRILMVYGEHGYDPHYLVDDILAAYSVKSGPNGEIRRINVNIAPMDTEDFKILKTANIGTFQCFQETYNRDAYKKYHLLGKKTDFEYRLNSQHRAVEAGIDDVAIGALFGLFDYRFEVLAMMQHARQLEKDFNGIGPHTISFPRLEPAQNAPISEKPPYMFSDYVFKKIVAVTRIAIPYTGLILSTRETPKMRQELLELGISQISGASTVYPGGYKAQKTNQVDEQQFFVQDDRTVDDIIYELAKNGYIPSFCTACYRKGRTGDHFMGLAKTAFIKNHCTPNAILTFAEYLKYYASPKTKEIGMKLIAEELDKNMKKNEIISRLDLIEKGEGDQYF